MDTDTERPSSSRRGVLGALGAAATSSIAGCSSATPLVAGSNDADRADYRVGVITSRTGPYSFLGTAEYQGALVAERELEAKYGVDITLVQADTETSVEAGVGRMADLVEAHDVDFALGGVSSSVAVEMGKVASEAGVPYMAAGSHSDTTTGSACRPHTYRPTCSNSMLANAFGSEMVDYADSWFVMYADYGWGKTGLEAVKRALDANGGELVGSVATPFPNDDYRPALEQAVDSGAEGLAVVVAGTDQRLVMEQFVEREYHTEIKMGGPLYEEAVFWGLSKRAGSLAGLWATPWATSEPTTGVGRSLREQVVSRFDTSPFSRHYMGYTSLDQLVRAAERAGSTDAEAVRAELEGHTLSNAVKPGENTFRAADHQLLQPVSVIESVPVSEMRSDPYKSWTRHVATKPGSAVARSPSDTGCSL